MITFNTFGCRLTVLLTVVAMLFTGVILAVPAFSAERRVALVIGNGHYETVARLPNPVSDAELVATSLRDSGFESVTLAQDLTRERLVDALRRFSAEAANADWAVIYYAGHGIEMGGTNYLIPTDARLARDRDLQFEGVPMTQAMAAVEGARRFRLLILDACRDNPFAATMSRSLGATRSIGRGLARVEPAPGTLVAFAAKDGQVAEDGDGAHGPYATALAQHMRTPGLEVARLFRRVTGDVLVATNRRQESFTYGSLPDEDFYFRAPPLPTQTTVTDPSEVQPAPGIVIPNARPTQVSNTISGIVPPDPKLVPIIDVTPKPAAGLESPVLVPHPVLRRHPTDRKRIANINIHLAPSRAVPSLRGRPATRVAPEPVRPRRIVQRVERTERSIPRSRPPVAAATDGRCQVFNGERICH